MSRAFIQTSREIPDQNTKIVNPLFESQRAGIFSVHLVKNGVQAKVVVLEGIFCDIYIQTFNFLRRQIYCNFVQFKRICWVLGIENSAEFEGIKVKLTIQSRRFLKEIREKIKEKCSQFLNAQNGDPPTKGEIVANLSPKHADWGHTGTPNNSMVTWPQGPRLLQIYHKNTQIGGTYRDCMDKHLHTCKVGTVGQESSPHSDCPVYKFALLGVGLGDRLQSH